jgi:hypothetical protein
MMNCFLYTLFLAVQIVPFSILVVFAFIFIIIAIIWTFNNKRIKSDFSEGHHSYLGNSTETIDNDLKQMIERRKKASDLEILFMEFKKSEIYVKTVKYLISNDEDNAPNMVDLRKMLYGHFIDFRLYLHSVAPNMVATDIDYCILTLVGFKQKEMHKLLNISPSGIRNIKPRLKDKLPADLYNNFFQG